ncbi:MAG: amidohydrolase [Chloroflexota bacterium]|jgi:predicted amidohydrolase YtcJ|nr:amidohydrolase [Chloroflexota bacterium]
MLFRDLSPDLILYNGNIHTFDKTVPQCSAIACKDGRVIALGDDSSVRALAGQRTQQIDLAGKTAVPGLNDGHNHMLQLGIKMTRIQLDLVKSIAEMVELVRERAKITPPGQWIIGEGWNESTFAEGRLPNRHDIDVATSEHPVILQRFFNMDVVNSRGLLLAGITRDTPDPQGGKIEREANGEPSGILRAAAKQPVRSLLPKPTMDECIAALDAASSEYLTYGITSVLDPGLYPYEIQAYLLAHKAGRLRVRTNLMPSWHGFREDEHEAELDDRAANLGVFSGLGDDWLRLGGMKMAVDGGTTSRTAWMFQPFVGETVVRDYNRLDPAQLRRYFARGHELGWDIGIHAIGDRAHHECAAAFADVLKKAPKRDHRHNLIHSYFATEESLQNMTEYGLGAVIQPTFIYFEGDDLFRDVGETLAHQYKPMRTYLDRGIRVIATSDIPSTVHYNPYISLYALVTRKTHKGTLIAPQEAVTREEALYAYTCTAPWLTREEDHKGPLSLGYLADIAVLDRDYFTCPAEEIKDIMPVMTIVDGKVAWQKDG